MLCARLTRWLAWFLGGLAAHAEAERPPLEAGLRELGQLLFADAAATLAAVPPGGDGEVAAWRPVARALVLLNAPPRTAAKLTEAEALLRAGYSEGDERVAPVAGYYLARMRRGTMEEVTLMAEVRSRWPTHPLAEMGVVKAGMSRVFAAEDAPAREKVLVELEGEVAGLTDRVARRELHALIGHATLVTGGDARRALRHLLAAVEAGVPESSMRFRGYIIRIAELARELGETALAREYYERFQELFPRDDRQQVVRERLAELAAKETAS
jgi:hypothetical protein